MQHEQAMAPGDLLSPGAPHEPADPVVVVRGLRTSYGSGSRRVDAVRGVSFEVRRGEILGIVGESGSGKSTLLMSILRLLPADAEVEAESIRFEGRDLLALSDDEVRALRGREIGLVPQRPMTSLSPVSSIRAQLRRFLAHLPTRAAQDAAIDEMLGRVHLRPVIERLDGYPHEFSGGQLQRILIATAALSGRPKLLFADEPTSTLDVTVQAQVLKLIVDLRAQLGVSIVLVTHDLGVVAQTCDRVGVMYAGRLVEVADVRALFDEPRHPYTQALLNAVPSRHARGERLTSIPGSIGDLADLPAGCAFAPRCSRVHEICWTHAPAARHAGASTVHCHLYPE